MAQIGKVFFAAFFFKKKQTLSSFRWHLGAVVLYLAASWLFIDHGMPVTRVILGQGADPQAYIWFLAWLPYAVSHHLNPFYSHYVWQPEGLNLGWVASVPLLALLAMPITWLGGPMLAYNVLAIAAPAFAASGAYALCLYITRQPAAALLGGYLFGFSTYEMAQSIAHLNLSFTVFVPLLLLVGLARLDDVLPRSTAVLLTVILLAAQYGVSLEIFATEIIFGALTWVLAWACYPGRRVALFRLLIDGLWAAPVLLAVLAPLLWVMFVWPHHALPAAWPGFFSTDIANLLVPTTTTALGGMASASLAKNFTGFAPEQDAYMGFLLLGIVVVFCARHNRFFGLLSGIILLLSLGPFLNAGGMASQIPLPWWLGSKIPFLQAALPARFMMYESLLVTVIAALWVAAPLPGRMRNRRLLMGGLAGLLLLPPLYPGQPDPSLRFFAPGRVQAVLGDDAKLLILPFGAAAHSSFWQAESKFSFVQAGGYLGMPDALLLGDVPMQKLFGGGQVPGLAADFSAYCRRTGTDYVIATPDTPPALMAMLRNLAWPVRRVDDVTVVTVPYE